MEVIIRKKDGREYKKTVAVNSSSEFTLDSLLQRPRSRSSWPLGPVQKIRPKQRRKDKTGWLRYSRDEWEYLRFRSASFWMATPVPEEPKAVKTGSSLDALLTNLTSRRGRPKKEKPKTAPPHLQETEFGAIVWELEEKYPTKYWDDRVVAVGGLEDIEALIYGAMTE